MADNVKAIGGNFRIFVACAALLILTCLWRVFVPAHEYGSATSVWLGIIVDAMLMIGLVGLYAQLSGAIAVGDSRRSTMGLLFVPGLAAGVAIFAIRFLSEHGWWTGHLRYALE